MHIFAYLCNYVLRAICLLLFFSFDFSKIYYKMKPPTFPESSTIPYQVCSPQLRGGENSRLEDKVQPKNILCVISLCKLEDCNLHRCTLLSDPSTVCHLHQIGILELINSKNRRTEISPLDSLSFYKAPDGNCKSHN